MTGAPAKPGDLIADKYRVEHVLGAGAMGMVVSAIHTELLERRALKIMLDPGFEEGTRAERFVREARALARVKSEHVATVHDIGRMKDGAPFIVMELLDGRDLKAVLDVVGKLSVSDAIFLITQACTGIAAAHALGIVHRDLKPANLFLTRPTEGGTPVLKIVDFGIAKIAGQAGDMEITKDADLLGTPLYMSPEQMRGATQVDPRTDIWALGAILYRMLGGRTPFEGSTVTEICAAVVADDPPSLRALAPEVPEAIERIVMRCLEKRPDRRFASAIELRDALAATMSGPAVARPNASAMPRPAPPSFEPSAAPPPPPPATTLTTPGLQATLNATSWFHASGSPTAATAAAPRARSKAGAVVAASLAVAVLAGGAFAAIRTIPGLTQKNARKPSTTSSVQPMPTPAGLPPGDPSQASSRGSAQPREGLAPSSAIASGPSPSASAPTASVSAAVAPSAIPSSPSSTARRVGGPPSVLHPTTPAMPPPVYVPPPPPPTDAFGRERK